MKSVKSATVAYVKKINSHKYSWFIYDKDYFIGSINYKTIKSCENGLRRFAAYLSTGSYR